jgi:hypothetical protein
MTQFFLPVSPITADPFHTTSGVSLECASEDVPNRDLEPFWKTLQDYVGHHSI